MEKLKSLASEFIQSESAGGVLLVAAAFLAMILANSPLSSYYNLFIATPVHIRIGPLELAKPLLLWVNDGLMAGFFFLVGLELKREVLIGELQKRSSIVLPAMGALGGMLVPALVYTAFNLGDPVALRGWAIPTATDIAFALGILSLLGSRVPVSLKVLLTTLAIFDDIGAILIIALFYTEAISLFSLAVVACCILILLLMNSSGQEKISMYVFVGSIMWVALLKSGVHATLAGVLLAMFIPMHSRQDPDHSPLIRLEHDLQAVVAYFILPIFAFCNSGIDFVGASLPVFFHRVPVGIALGLFFGKQVGVLFFLWIAIRLRLAAMPRELSWSSLYGLSCLCGIGFTMSLFIGALAFGQTVKQPAFDERFGIMTGSLVSGIVGFLILRKSLGETSAEQDEQGNDNSENHQP
ncbi:MAG TPA: Na+/H+ antiporter NhaA [Desulfobulbaceae bacterium]|nr:Na+/H+ antiporter NhaA [Desulfobulbaceae bacterium]